ncbi:MAG: hypothetical protein C0404_05805 [Verrucomicrobia bacterium]|nr:hypothetical protein [Verrucomicrobiota bacterium]
MKDESGQKLHAEPVNRAIERAKLELENMIDLNPQVMMLVDKNGVITRANSALINLLGLGGYAEVLGKRLSSLFSCDDSAFFDQLLHATSGHRTRETHVQLCSDQKNILSFTAVPSGRGSGLYVVIVEDVTAEREKASQLEKEHKKEAVQALVGALLHNVNQPLTVILVRAHLMRLALEKGESRPGEILKNLQDIVKLTVQVADMLKLMETPRDFVMESYIKGVEILDLKKSGDSSNKWEAFSWAALKAMLRMMDTHEPGAITHAAHTSEYAALIARKLSLPDDTVKSIRHAGLFHDIGKIGIPDSILQKPAPLTPEEKEIIRKHPEMGYVLMQNLPLMDVEAETAFCHHEHFDGSGYPRGLKGDAIPLASQIVAVADSFDAIHYRRLYHEPVRSSEVVQEIIRGSGTHYAPEIVRAFKSCCEEDESPFKRDNAGT